jgi:sec-independent protein translocase protein TatB
MFGSIGGPEIILIFIVALIVFGPKRLPEIGRQIGKVVADIRRATTDMRSNVEREIGFDPLDGLKEAGKARREIITSLSDPIRDVAKGAIDAARVIPAETVEALRHVSAPERAPGTIGSGSLLDAAGPYAWQATLPGFGPADAEPPAEDTAEGQEPAPGAARGAESEEGRSASAPERTVSGGPPADTRPRGKTE